MTVITILFSVTVKSGTESDFEALISKITDAALTEDAGCVTYAWLRQKGVARSYALFEQWTDQESLDAHVRHLYTLVGSTSTSEGLPSAITDMIEYSEATIYEVIA